MEKVNLLFGDLKVKKLGTFHVETVNRPMDVFGTKIITANTDHIGMIVMTPHQGGERTTVKFDQLDWYSLHVRTYGSRSDLENAFKKVAQGNKIKQLISQKVKNPAWTDEADIELKAVRATNTTREYDSNVAIPFKVTLHSVNAAGPNDSDLEREIELIPALQTMNFTLVKRAQ